MRIMQMLFIYNAIKSKIVFHNINMRWLDDLACFSNPLKYTIYHKKNVIQPHYYRNNHTIIEMEKKQMNYYGYFLGKKFQPNEML